MTKLDTPHNEIFLQEHELSDILNKINERIGLPVLQHSSELQFAEHTDDEINVFGPKGQFHALRGLGSILHFYEYFFPGRNALTKNRGTAPSVGTFIKG
jgi:hypothetical protein